MLKVLQDWDEIGGCYHSLLTSRLPTHPRVEKNFDLYNLREFLKAVSRQARILDVGCSGLHTLEFLSALGFSRLHGVDLHLRRHERLRPFRTALHDRTLRLRYRLHEGDLLNTRFPARSFDVVTCISTLEHGVDPEALLDESRRLLSTGGLLYLTTDYWEDPIEIPGHVRPFGLPWRVFSKPEIEGLIELAREAGFALSERGAAIPSCSDACVRSLYGPDYTFVCLEFVAA